jgi:GT2 family glycosyltransferase
MDRIAILYTTFLRDELMAHTVKSIQDNWQNNYTLLIADQGYPRVEKLKAYNQPKNNTYYVILPFDCGLSEARNFLVECASQLKIKYCLLTADSIAFMAKYDFEPIIAKFESDPSIAIIGLNLKDRVPWEGNLDIVNGSFRFTKVMPSGEPYTQSDICRNFFIARTEALLANPWDKHLKLCEHEDFFWRLKTGGYKNNKVLFTPQIKAQYIKAYSTPEYQLHRQRLYGEFKQKLLAKYNLRTWMTYK